MICCSLFVVCSSAFVFRFCYMLLFIAVCCFSFVDCVLKVLFVICYSCLLIVGCWSLCVARCWLFVACCVLSGVFVCFVLCV